jgi:hypothetical protein
VVSALILLTCAFCALAGAEDLDPTFSGNGKLTTDFPSGDSAASGVAIQPDGNDVKFADGFVANSLCCPSR